MGLPLLLAGLAFAGNIMDASASASADEYNAVLARQDAEANALAAMNSAAGAEYNARIQRENAKIARQQAAAEAERIQMMSRKVQGAARAAYGASGVALEGSPMEVLRDSAIEAELDVLTAKYQGELSARNALHAAALERWNASTYRWRAQVYRRGGNLQSDIYRARAGNTMATGTLNAVSAAGQVLLMTR